MTRYTMVLALLMLTGCVTTNYRPVVDTGEVKGNYEDDVADCQRLAEQRPAGAQAANGAVVGAVLGGVLAAAFGLRGNNIGRVAAWGAVNGAAGGAVNGASQQQAIVARCMEGRGYAVVSP